MALEKFFHIQLVAPKLKASSFRDFLHDEGALHLENISSITKPYYPSEDEEQQIHEEISQVKSIFASFDKLFPVTSSFIENFIPNKPIYSRQQIQELDESFSVKDFYRTFNQLIKEKNTISVTLQTIDSQIRTLVPLEHLTIPFEELHDLKKVCILIIKADDKQITEFSTIPFIQNHVVVEIVKSDTEQVMVLVSKPEHLHEIQDYLKRFDLDELDWRKFEGIAYQILGSLKQKKTELEAREIKIQDSLFQLSQKRDILLLKKDLLDSRLNKINEASSFAESQYVVMVDGFLPQSSLPTFETHIQKEYPEVYMQKKIAVEAPIKYNNNGFFQPFEFIIRMFGVPRSGLIDPTPVVAIVYLILFGLAFGDVIYGISLILISLLFIKAYKQDKGVVNFFKLFLYSGISAIFFGAITNSWAGDLISLTYIKNPNNFLIKLSNYVKVINSMEQVMTLLIAILYLGAFIQMLGVFCAMLQNIKEKNYKDAFFDQFTWLIFIPSAFIFAGEFLAAGYYPATLIAISKIGLLTSIVLIFIGGFLKSKNPAIRVVKGLLNMYGIVSSYGIASILSDVLSYLRLLALAIATASMAMSFNIISFLIKNIPVLGPILVVVLLILTNGLNFLLSILSAFIHPVRLVFYEFFGRFFQDGGTDYKPYSNQYKHVLVNEEAKQ